MLAEYSRCTHPLNGFIIRSEHRRMRGGGRIAACAVWLINSSFILSLLGVLLSFSLFVCGEESFFFLFFFQGKKEKHQLCCGIMGLQKRQDCT